MEYYVYEYLREDGTPYYIGKGKGSRYRQRHTVAVPPRERIRFIKENMIEEEAIKLEIELIAKYGRKDLGTGILRNQTNGGDGGVNVGPLVRKKLSMANKGRTPWNKGVTGWKCDPDGFENRSRAKSGEKHPMHGKHHTDEARQKISEGIKANWDRPIQTCPHCGKQGKVGMTRWHFDNCKHKDGN